MRGESTVRGDHRARTAVIYVRQSTLAQVRDHTESTARQYALAGEASRLGWPAGGIEVIDTDLGVSRRSTEGRDGFKALAARVCLGEVGSDSDRLQHLRAVLPCDVRVTASSHPLFGRLLAARGPQPATPCPGSGAAPAPADQGYPNRNSLLSTMRSARLWADGAATSVACERG
jgi:hypothetical protein